uniref:GyrI-like domain-containing protein n=1 Tax=Paenibacillus terrae TaxID=159743 RepID=UPI0011A0B2FB|nr:GyrI-like domain-containing protein [Paenibacillus terrae]
MKLDNRKLDLTKAYPSYYSAPQVTQKCYFDEIPYLTIDGEGDPNGPGFAEATEALYTVAYGIKGMYKQEDQDFTVAKLEGLWWARSHSGQDAMYASRDDWMWKLLIRMPDYASAERFEEARMLAVNKKPHLVPLRSVSFERLYEGHCVQMLHVGPFSTEPETIRQIFEYIEAQRLTPKGRHHEIYLSDPRRTPPHKMRTILRHPVIQQEN